MHVDHLSASSVKLYLACPAQWRARYVHKGTGMSGEAANRGTVFHLALERLVNSGDHLGSSPYPRLVELWVEAHGEVIGGLLPLEAMEATNALLRKWCERQDWDDREVISTEQRTEFMLHDAANPVPFVYIIDRLDRTHAGIEVIDYKSGRFMLNHDGLRNELQALSYATAVWLQHPDQRRYWVTFDYLQGDPIGVAFTPYQCEAHYEFLCKVADRIAADDGEEERLNSMCRFCDRKHSCQALKNHMGGGGYLGLDQPELVSKRVELAHAATAIKTALEEIDGVLVPIFEKDDTLETLTGFDPDHKITLASTSRRFVDMEIVQQHLSDADLASYGKLGVKDLEVIISEKALGAGWDAQKIAGLRKAIQLGRTRAAIKVVE